MKSQRQGYQQSQGSHGSQGSQGYQGHRSQGYQRAQGYRSQARSQNRYQRSQYSQEEEQPPQPQRKLTIVRKGEQTSSQKIVGTSSETDKRFVRSTGVPIAASNVRPAPVLEKALEFAVAEYERTHSYFDFMDRAKAIRQDLTVQGLHQGGDLAKRVYTANGRIALACKDFGEFNVCQTHLLAIYGKDRDQTCYEFLGFRILYNALFSRGSEDARFLTKEDVGNPVVSYAMKLCTLFVANDYLGFFKTAAPKDVPVPEMTPLIEEMARLVRDSSLRRLLGVVMTPLDKGHLMKALGFGAASEEKFKEFAAYYKIAFAPDGKVNNREALRVIASIPPPRVSVLYKR